MNKRIFTFVLCIVMMLSAVGGASATESAVDSGKATAFLEDLGIITTEIADMDAAMSREEFAVYVARMLKVDTKASENVRYFIDVEMDGYAVGAINSLAELGLISMADDGKFRPQEPITMQEAAKMLVVAIGRKEQAEYKGGYPGGYMMTASGAEILNGVQAGKESVSYGDAFIMIRNTMEAEVMSIEIFGPDGNAVQYDNNDEYTILKNIWNILEAEGTVSAVYGASADGTVVEEKNEIVLSGETYEISDTINADDLFGEYINVYYTEDDNSKHKQIVSVEKSAKGESVLIGVESFAKYETNKISFYSDASRIREIVLDAPVFVYNGYPLKSDIANKISNINKGDIEVKDSDGNGKYDLVIIRDFANFIVSGISNGAVYDKLGSAAIEWNGLQAYRVYTAEGYVASEADIKIGQSLSVARSEGNVFVDVIMSETEVSGSVSGHKESDGVHFLTVNGAEYAIEKSYAEKIKDIYPGEEAVGQSFKFTIDAFGNIVYMVKTESSMKTGFITETVYEEAGFSKYAKLKMLTEANKFEVLELAEKTSVNGKSYREVNEAFDAIPLNGEYGHKQLIRYGLNSEGKINDIRTASYNAWYGDDKSGFQQLYESNQSQRYIRGKLGERATLTANSLVFFIPYGKTELEEEDCLLTSYSILIDDMIYTSNSYIFERDGILVDAAVCYYTPEQLSSNRMYTKPIMMVESISEKITSAGDLIYSVQGYSSGAKTEILVPDELSVEGIEEGDIVMFYYDARGNIVAGKEGESYTMLCKRKDVYENGKPNWTNNKYHDYLYYASADAISNYYRAEFQLSFGHVLNVAENAVAWDRDMDGRFDETAQVSGNVVIFDSSRRDGQHIYAGKTGDIKTYNSVGMECGKIILRTRGQVVVETFIYQ